MPDVTASIAPADVRLWVSLDAHKLSIVAATFGRVLSLHSTEASCQPREKCNFWGAQ